MWCRLRVLPGGSQNEVKRVVNFTYTDDYSFLNGSFRIELNFPLEHPPIRKPLVKSLPEDWSGKRLRAIRISYQRGANRDQRVLTVAGSCGEVRRLRRAKQ